MHHWAVMWPGKVATNTWFPLECVWDNISCHLPLYITHVIRADGIFLPGFFFFFFESFPGCYSSHSSLTCPNIAYILSSFPYSLFLPICLYLLGLLAWSLWYHLHHIGLLQDNTFYNRNHEYFPMCSGLPQQCDWLTIISHHIYPWVFIFLCVSKILHLQASFLKTFLSFSHQPW